MELDPHESPGGTKSREVEMGSQKVGQPFASVVSQQKAGQPFASVVSQQKVGQPFASVVSQQLLLGHCLKQQ